MVKKDRKKTMEREVWEGILGREWWFLYLRDAWELWNQEDQALVLLKNTNDEHSVCLIMDAESHKQVGIPDMIGRA